MGRGRVLLCPVTLTLGPARGQLCSCCVLSLWAGGSSGHVPRRAARRQFCVGGSQAGVAGPEQVRGRGGGGVSLQDTAGVSQAWGSPWESLATCRTLGPSQAGRGPTFEDKTRGCLPEDGGPRPVSLQRALEPLPHCDDWERPREEFTLCRKLGFRLLWGGLQRALEGQGPSGHQGDHLR